MAALSLQRGASILFLLLILVGALNISKTNLDQWSSRPKIECDNGVDTYRFASVSANRVNIRNMPTVFSKVLTQKNQPDALLVICEFGVWSRVNLPNLAKEAWVSSGLIIPDQLQPIAPREKIFLIFLVSFGALGLTISIFKLQWLEFVIQFILQTQELPPHAKPLISKIPEFHPARDAESSIVR